MNARARTAHRVTRYAADVLAGRIVAGPYVRLACERHQRDLKRAGRTRDPFWFDEAAATRAIDFFEHELVLPDMLDPETGDCLPFVLSPWQAFIVGSLFGWKKPDGHRRFRTAYIETGKGSGKALAIDTPIPTLRGWKAMGDVEVGDVLFDESGKPTTVVGAFDVMEGHECYRVTFDNGDSIIADADHLWVTEQRSRTRRGEPLATKGVPLAQRGAWRRGIRTTRQIAETLRYANGRYQSANHSIAVAGALQAPDRVLPVDPYVLGVWLGDGDSDGNRVTCGISDVEPLTAALRATGTDVGAPRLQRSTGRVRVGGNGKNARGLRTVLREIGVLRNKHIPAGYLRGSVPQRQSLLQGLMDSDGWIAAEGNACEFTSMDGALAAQVAELLASLGVKAFRRSKLARVNGRVVGTAWQVRFTAPEWPVFRLPRKAQRQRVCHARRKLSGDHRIVACEPVPSVPVRCIAVDSPSRLFLAGRSMVPTHNTPLAAGIALYCLVADGQRYPEVYSAAVSQKQATIPWTDADRMVEHAPRLGQHIERKAHVLVGRRSGGKFEAVSSEKRALEGKRPHCAVLEELHEHPNDQVVTKMRRGTKRNKDALIVEITNAGIDRTSICFRHHEMSRKVLEQVITNDSWFAYVCALDDGDDFRNPAVWPKANPNIGVTIDGGYLQEAITECEGDPAAESEVRRLNFCEWLERQSAFLQAARWQGGRVDTAPDLTGIVPFGGLDLGETDDLSAFALVWPLEGDRYFGRVWYWTPEEALKKHKGRPWAEWRSRARLTVTDGNVTDFLRVRQDVSDIAREAGCEAIAYDKRFAQQMAQELQAEGFTMIDQPQGFALNEPTRKLGALVADGAFLHEGDPLTTFQASNVIVIRGTRGDLRPDKEKSPEKIDGIVATIMALGRAMLDAAAPDSPYEDEDYGMEAAG